MPCPFNEEQLAQLKAFVELCKAQPLILQDPKLSFFKDYLVSLGVSIPTATFTSHKTASAAGDASADSKTKTEEAPVSSSEETDDESDLELDMEGVIEDVPVKDQEMGDPTKEPTDEERDESDNKRGDAMMAFSEQQYDKAIDLYSEAIKLNPQSALLFAKRGQVYLKENKLNACIKDCTQALELNCDSSAAFKIRGRAYSLLGKFEEAAHDLCESLKIDYDDQTNMWLADVKPNADKIRQHKLNAQRKKEDKERREKIRRARKAQEARVKAAKEQEASAQAQGRGGAMPNTSSFPLFNNPDLGDFVLDSEVLEAFQDPEVAKMFNDVCANPANYSKYQNNPKIASVVEMIQKKMGKRGPGAPTGGPPGGAGGAPPAANPCDDDVGLD